MIRERNYKYFLHRFSPLGPFLGPSVVFDSIYCIVVYVWPAYYEPISYRGGRLSDKNTNSTLPREAYPLTPSVYAILRPGSGRGLDRQQNKKNSTHPTSTKERIWNPIKFRISRDPCTRNAQPDPALILTNQKKKKLN